MDQEVATGVALAIGVAGTAVNAGKNRCREWVWKLRAGLDPEGLAVYDYVSALGPLNRSSTTTKTWEADAIGGDSSPVEGSGSNEDGGAEVDGRRLRLLPGRRLHEVVPPEKWAVTKGDFLAFVRLARARWEIGEIPDNEAHPNPGHKNERIGPSMYQVTEHFIKPVTREAGGMSWALMCRREGLPCDLFVSHAWSEGLFEFKRHLARSWPWKAKHLWCCFLANPQCLNVHDLLNVPLDRSPFARALAQAPEFIVIPNTSTSIYSRLWCVYEISVAMRQEKAITMPTAELGDVLLAFASTYGWCILAGLLGALVALTMRRTLQPYWASPVLTWPTLATVSLWRSYLDGRSKWLIYTLFFFIGLLGGGMNRLFFFLPGDDGDPIAKAPKFQDYDYLLEVIALPCLLFTFAASGVYDEVYFGMEAQLQHSTVRRAQCSNVADRFRILAAIRGSEAAIDTAVKTLIKAGNFNRGVVDLGQQGFPLDSLRYNPAAFVLPLPVAVLMICIAPWPRQSTPDSDSNADASGAGAGAWVEDMLVLSLYVLQLVFLGAVWTQALRSSERWQRCLWLRRLDQTAWLIAGARYVIYSYERCGKMQTLSCDRSVQNRIVQEERETLCQVDHLVADMFRQIFVAPIWFSMPLCDGIWSGAEMGVQLSTALIIILALMHWKAIVGRAVLLYGKKTMQQTLLNICGTLNVVGSYFIVLHRVRQERWRQQRVLVRRIRLISGLSLIVTDLLFQINLVSQVMVAVIVKFLSNKFDKSQACPTINLIVSETLHLVAPVLNLLALYEPIWRDRLLSRSSQSFTRVLSDPNYAGGVELSAPSTTPLLDVEGGNACFESLPTHNLVLETHPWEDGAEQRTEES